MTYLTPSDTAMYRKGIQVQAQYGLSYGIASLFDSFVVSGSIFECTIATSIGK